MSSSTNTTGIGTLLCVMAAIVYTAMNIFLCDVSSRCDASWVNGLQATVSVAVSGLILAFSKPSPGKTRLPRGGVLFSLVIIGLITQAGGVMFVWSMSVVGAAVSVTVQTGVMLAVAALLGLLVLGERVSWKQVAAIGLIAVSVLLFSVGKGGGVGVSGLFSLRSLLGLLASIMAGVAFAVLTVGVRKTVTGDTSPMAVVFLINLMGVLALGGLSLFRLGPHALLQTSPKDVGIILAAGGVNLVGFFLVTKSLQLITVVRLNVLNKSLSTALTAVAGVWLLSERWNGTLTVAAVLAMVGIVLISASAPPPIQVEQDPD